MKKMPPNYKVPGMDGKLLLALQFWEGDKALAQSLIDVLVETEQESHCKLADLLIVSRFDCEIPRDMVLKASRKFNTHTWRCDTRFRKGWPLGCNDLWFATMERAEYLQHTLGWPYKAIFTFEADGGPIRRDWIRALWTKWNHCQPNVYVVGDEVASKTVEAHINGNALFSGHPAFLSWLTREVCSVEVPQGWDYYLRKAFRGWGVRDIPEILSIWNTPTISEEYFKQICRTEAVWVHGVKNETLHGFIQAQLRGQLL